MNTWGWTLTWRASMREPRQLRVVIRGKKQSSASPSRGDRIGIVEARMTMMGRNYQDLLTLINTSDGWRVLTKVFSFVERKD